MSHFHIIVKIAYAEMGFLPNYPYHLISDDEMFEAFLREDDGFFATYYPCPHPDLQDAYDTLLNCIKDHIHQFQKDTTKIPDWVYSYMIMNPVTFQSPEEDIDYICEMANIDKPNILAEFTPQVAATCYAISKKWLQKMPSAYRRPPTMFGEPHVIKSLRLTQANVLLDSDFEVNF